MPFSIERNDLALMEVDAIVVAANEQMQITGGVGAQVAAKAGFEQLQRACNEIGFCPTGCAVATPAFDAPAQVIVHAVGPVWNEGEHYEESLLRATYDSALRCAAEAGATSIALPLISAGTYGVPPAVSFRIATDAIRSFLLDHDADVRLVLYNRAAVAAALQEYGEIAEYIDDHYVDVHAFERWSAEGARGRDDAQAFGQSYPLQQAPIAPRLSGDAASRLAAPSADAAEPCAAASTSYAAAEPPAPKHRSIVSRIGDVIQGSRFGRSARGLRRGKRKASRGSYEVREELEVAEEANAAFEKRSVPQGSSLQRQAVRLEPTTGAPIGLSEMLDALDAPFSTTLLALIDARGMTDAQVYKRANMSRQLFSKIRSDASYRPTKKTVLALAIALGLNLDETCDLLRRAGFALSNSSKADVIVEYFITRGNYDIFAINEALYAFDQPLL